jgi:NAD(P)-dependent dehydrogenase (short-subunit alcohol dehydrogenase family)
MALLQGKTAVITGGSAGIGLATGLDTLAGTLSIVPLARSATAEEVANAALFLVADLTHETLP